MDLVIDNPNMPWVMAHLSANPAISTKNILENSRLWSIHLLNRPNLTNELVGVVPNNERWDYISIFNSITMEHIKANPHKPWDYNYVMFNKNVTWDFYVNEIIPRTNQVILGPYLSISMTLHRIVDLKVVEHTLDANWDWGKLSKNPSLTWDFIRKYASKDWNWDLLSIHPNITWEIILSNLFVDDMEINWDWTGLSRKPNIPWSFVKKNMDKPWVWKGLSSNSGITWDIMQSHPFISWNFCLASENPNITCRIALENPHLNWNWNYISKKPDLTWELVKKHHYDDSMPVPWDCVRIPWDWHNISKHENITIKNISENSNYPWDWSEVSWRPDITCDIVQKHRYTSDGRPIPWNWLWLSCNPSITWDMIQAHPEIPWDWRGISDNRNITPQIVRDNKFLKSGNPTTWCCVKTPTPWNWRNLSSNPMDEPYFQSVYHGKHLAKQLVNAIFTELIAKTCHPLRHPANYMAECDLAEHPFHHLSQDALWSIQ